MTYVLALWVYVGHGIVQTIEFDHGKKCYFDAVLNELKIINMFKCTSCTHISDNFTRDYHVDSCVWRFAYKEQYVEQQM